MEYDRVQVKLAAKAVIRETQPKPWVVTLVYLILVELVSMVMSVISMVPMIAATLALATEDYGAAMAGFGGSSFLMVFLPILISLYSMVMQFGYANYAMRVSRREPSGIGDLFRGFSMVGRVLALFLLITLFSGLWGLLGGVVIGLIIGLAAALLPPSVTVFLFIVSYMALLFFIFNRILRYSLATYVLLDHPELGALSALNESKRLMKGRLWSYFVLSLSFFGWGLLVGVIFMVIFIPGLVVIGGGGLFAAIEMGASAGAALAGSLVGILILSIVALLVSSILGLWLTAYMNVATVGFYDAIPKETVPVEAPPVAYTYTPPTMSSATEAMPAEPEPAPVPTPEPDDEPEL